MKTLLKGGLALFDLATAGINLAINAVMDIFKWGDPKTNQLDQVSLYMAFMKM